MAKKIYEVIRPHYGEKQYDVGDEREADSNDVAHLVPDTLKEKAESKSKNKAAAKSSNKAAK